MNDDLSPRAMAFLREVEDGDDPTVEDYRRVHAAVRSRLALGVAVGVASALSSKAAPAAVAPTVASAAPVTLVAAGVGATLTTKIVAAVLLVGAAAGGATAVVRAGHANAARESVAVLAPPVRAEGPLAAPAPQSTPAPAPDFAPAPAPESALAPALAPSPRPRMAAAPAPVTAPAALTSAPASTASSLDAEIAILRDARAALRSGDGGRALGLLDQHDRRFPGGTLSEDAAAERIFALCALGRSAEAGALAAGFLAAHPASPYAASVRASCGAGGGSK